MLKSIIYILNIMFRKIYHLGGLIFPVILLLFKRNIALYISGILFVLILIFDMFRLQYKEFNLLIIKKLPIRLKRKEVKSLTGSPFFLGGVFLTILLFELEYAIGGIIFLCIGDMAAVTIGKNFGRIKIFSDKTLEGTLAFVVSTILAMILIKSFGIINIKLNTIIIGAFFCAIIESLPWKIDDNLTIPIAGAFILKILS